MAQLWLSQKLSPDTATTFPGTQKHIKSECLCWPRQRRQDRSSMQELKQGLACDALKTSVPQYRVQNTSRNQGKGKDAAGGQMVLLPNTSHSEITDWTVETLAEQNQKYTGAVGSKIRPASQLTNFYLCVSSGHKYILQQVVEKVRKINYTT